MTIDTAAENITKVQGELATIDRIEAGFAALSKLHPVDVAIDVTTAKGMKEAVTARAAWRDPRIAIEKSRKAAKAPVLELGRAIDARASALTERLLVGEANYDDQIKAQEARKEAEKQRLIAAEIERVATIQKRIADIRAVPPAALTCSAETAAGNVAAHDQFAVDESFQEFREQAEQARVETLTRLREIHAAAVAREAEAARVAAEREELARLRTEQETRNKAERERIAAEQAAEAQRLAAQRHEIDRRERAAAAEIERQQAAARAEQQRLDAEAAATRRAADDAARAEREEADRVARAQRAAEDQQLAAERAELQRQQEEQRATERARMKAETERLAAEHAAQERVTAAAPQMFDALKQWLNADETGDAEELANARIARDAALEAAGELLDVPY